MKYCLTVLFVATLCFNSLAQTSVELPATVKEKQEERIEQRKNKGTATYYTVMMYFGGDKDKAYSLKTKFLSKYRDSANTYELDIKWEEPYFKLYAGKFTSAIEAQKLIAELKKWLPNVILVRKEMEFPKL
jgi:hypothetical protein